MRREAQRRSRSVSRGPTLAICGSGNAGHALAVVASTNLDAGVEWLVGSREKAARLRGSLAESPLSATGVLSGMTARIGTISSDPEQVIPRADIVLIAVPAFAHAAVLRRIAPFLHAGMIVGCLPTRGGFEFDARALIESQSGHRPTIFGLQTLPWSTRVTSFGRTVHIGAVKQQVVLASLPAGRAQEIANQMQRILGTGVVAARSFLGLTLGNPGQCIHPGLMFGHFRDWTGETFTEEDIPLLYAQATDEIGEVVRRLSDEAIAVARTLEAHSGGRLGLQAMVRPIHEWLLTAYGNVTADRSSVATCFRTGPIQARKAPMVEVSPGRYVPHFQYRYLSEDVPFGLVPTRALAEIAEIQTPAIDEVIGWAQTVLQKRYLLGGSMTGRDCAELPIPQNHGVSTIAELIDWHVGDGPRAPTLGATTGPSRV